MNNRIPKVNLDKYLNASIFFKELRNTAGICNQIKNLTEEMSQEIKDSSQLYSILSSLMKLDISQMKEQ